MTKSDPWCALTRQNSECQVLSPRPTRAPRQTPIDTDNPLQCICLSLSRCRWNWQRVRGRMCACECSCSRWCQCMPECMFVVILCQYVLVCVACVRVLLWLYDCARVDREVLACLCSVPTLRTTTDSQTRARPESVWEQRWVVEDNLANVGCEWVRVVCVWQQAWAWVARRSSI